MSKAKALFFCDREVMCSDPAVKQNGHHDVEMGGAVYGVDFCTIDTYGWVRNRRENLYTLKGIIIVSLYDAGKMVDVDPQSADWARIAQHALRMESANCREDLNWRISRKLLICRCPKSSPVSEG